MKKSKKTDEIINMLIAKQPCNCGVELEKRKTFNEDDTEMYIETICPICGVVQGKLTCVPKYQDKEIEAFLKAYGEVLDSGEGETFEGLINGLRKKNISEKMIVEQLLPDIFPDVSFA